MSEPNGSTGTAARGWRDEILREFTPGVARLTVVDDPDGLLAEAGTVEALRARGFEVLPAADRVAFRYFYESRHRSRRDRSGFADVVAVFGAARACGALRPAAGGGGAGADGPAHGRVVGRRTTATRAVRRIVRSFVEWGVLVEAGDRGTYAPAAKIPVAGVGPWLLEAGLLSSGRREYPFRALAAGAAFYPFDMTLSGQDIGGNPRLEICRQGLDEDVVVLIHRSLRRGTGSGDGP